MQTSQGPNQNSATGTEFRRRRFSGFFWILIVLAALFILGGLFTALRQQRPAALSAQSRANAEMNFGVEEFADAANGGVVFSRVAPPDSPADKAGLVGGDIVVNVDGRPVQNTNDILNLLRQTPVGKSVEVVYLRDGVSQQTRLTTISPEESERLSENFERRSSGHGSLGFEVTELVPVSGGNTSGVRLSKLSPSGPAILAGIQEGDIVIKFDGVPIRSRMEFLLRVRRAIPYSTVSVMLVRGTERLEIPVKVGKR